MANDVTHFIVVRYDDDEGDRPNYMKYLATEITEEINGKRVAIYAMSHDESLNHATKYLQQLLSENVRQKTKLSVIDTHLELQSDEDFIKIHVSYAKMHCGKSDNQVLIFVCDSRDCDNLSNYLHQDIMERIKHHSALTIKLIGDSETHSLLTPH
ncbi:hypothetical protein FWF48_00215 [Candidatus Saccharibacteria bacterium]|nr:hypothetical protein [Candidatus Saccharibacteria bacterium]